jgi:hypothetical protein
MFPRRLSVLMLAGAAGLALIGGCTRGPSGSQAAPTVTAATSPGTAASTTAAPGVSSLPPIQVDPTAPLGAGPSTTPATTTAADAGPDLSAVTGCPGCTVRHIRRAVRPGISVALLVGKKVQFQRAVLVSFRSRTGAVIDQLTGAGDYFTDINGKPTKLACDISFHCLLPASIGAHSAVMTVASVSRAGDLDLVTDKIGVDSPILNAQDLDGDSINEIVGVINDCQPACANGHDFWTAYKLAGPGYIEIGCAPYDRKARPPAKLSPAACPK